MRFKLDETIRVAAFDLITKRKIGAFLLQVDMRGGDRAKRQRASLLAKILEVLGKDKVKRCRAIARVEEQHFADYLKVKADQHDVPTEAGAVRHASRMARSVKQLRPRNAKKSKAESSTVSLSASALDAVQRALGRIDVCIGDAKVKCEVRLDANPVQDKEIRGRVFVSQCGEPGECLTKLADMKRKGAIEEVVVALPADVGASWFKLLAEGEWHCCFPTGGGALVAYPGMKKRGFAVIFGRLGAVLCGCATADSDQ